MSNKTIPLKIYLLNNDSRELEVRRCGIIFEEVSFFNLVSKIMDVFPQLKGTNFSIMWKDEEKDDVVISTNEELAIALKEMKSDLKKFFIKMKCDNGSAKRGNNSDVCHPGVFCDGCNKDIVGYRYKCLSCVDYDLCFSCEQMNVHPEHPMLRIPNPLMFSRADLEKLIHCYVFPKFDSDKYHSHHRRRHSHEVSGECRKKRKCEKHESGHETDDSEENCRKKHHHGKWKKMNRCVYTQLINDFFSQWDSSQMQSKETSKSETAPKSNEQTDNDTIHMKYLKNIGKTLSTVLDPLGIDVDFDIKYKNDGKEEKKPTEEPRKETTSPIPSTSQQKEVRFATPEQPKDTMKKEIDELAKVLANQKVNESPEEDDWVSIDELKRKVNDNGEESQKSSEPGKPQEPPTTATAPPQETQHIYPSLDSSFASNPLIAEAVDKMFSMGFKNANEWLPQLLEATKAFEAEEPRRNS